MAIFPKFLSHFPAPVGLVLILLGIAFYKRSRAWTLAAALILALLSSSFFSSWILGSLENAYPVVSPDTAPRTDAIVVLGGITRTTPTHPNARFDLSDSVERIDEGARLYRAGVAPFVVLTSGNHDRNPPEEGDFLRQFLLDRYGVPAEAVVHTARLSYNTSEEAANVRELMRARGWSRITLVTSAFHMSRAMMLFHKAKLDPVAHPVDFRSYRDPHEPAGNTWFPRSDFLNQTEIALREYYGIAYYKLLSVATRDASDSPRKDR
jgi:uncharacterized SAM-binding protein YcdF (DUF218 family)